MASESTLLPPMTEKVNMNTAPYINRSIQKRIDKSLVYYRKQNTSEIRKRLTELDLEWDTERVLKANLASVVLLSSILGLRKSKKWMILSGIASGFMIQHSLQGWCPPLSLIRRLNVRTASEINEERDALLQLLKERN
ncbi:YgaP-like transmembrane domain [Mesobacillus zeae]|uniref:DUF2892 domain-containing protein n=1 Tax=Mesobacillus zeae TaxID=1917180 RepID=A0A398B7W9_9BACI|nr:YgaP-like transmembrane domain [Mesobacillus zeae]RID84918.1 DUF2892 domain-containing protein [Mesobacillus zeae]